MKNILLAFTLLLFAGPLFGQGNNNQDTDLSTLKIGFLTKRLSLTPEEAQVFWPVYNQYQDELKVVKQDLKADYQATRQNFDVMTDAEVAELVHNYATTKDREHELFIKYHSEFQKVLPIRKVAKLYQAEQDFMRVVLASLRRQNNQNQRNGLNNGGNRPMRRFR